MKEPLPGSRCQKGDMRSEFLKEDPQILGATLQNLVTIATWHPKCVRLCHSGLCVCKMFMSLGSVLLGYSTVYGVFGL